MGLFGKSATHACQARDAEIIAHLRKEIARTGVLLTEAKNDLEIEREQHRLTAHERDSYREDALKHRSSRSHLKQYRPRPNGAGVAATGEVRT